MKVLAKDLKKGNKIKIAGAACAIEKIEFSDIGKHGKRKARIEVITEKNQKVAVIRPEDYPFEIIK